MKSWRRLKERGAMDDYQLPRGKKCYRKGTLYKPVGFQPGHRRRVERIVNQLALLEWLGRQGGLE